jgi:hypothetical protein
VILFIPLFSTFAELLAVTRPANLHRFWLTRTM